MPSLANRRAFLLDSYHLTHGCTVLSLFLAELWASNPPFTLPVLTPAGAEGDTDGVVRGRQLPRDCGCNANVTDATLRVKFRIVILPANKCSWGASGEARWDTGNCWEAGLHEVGP